MGSEVRILYKKTCFNLNPKKQEFEEPFYCKESPSEVIKQLLPKYHISKYNTLDSSVNVMGFEKSKDNGINNLRIFGIIVQEFNPKGIEITQSIKEYDPKINVENIKDPILRLKIFNSFIENYLIKKEIINPGSQTQDYHRRTTLSKMGKQKAVEYLKERDIKKDETKEKHLEDILDYGKAMFGEDFNINRLRKLSKRIAKNIPTEIYPIHTNFATLRPSSNFGFPKGPKFRG